MNAILPTIADETARQMEALLRQYPELADDEQLRADTFEGATNLNSVLKRLCNVLNSTEALLEGVRVDAAQLSKRRARFEARIEAVKGMMCSLLEVGKLEKVELSSATIFLRKKARSLVITDESALPSSMLKTVFQPMKAEIKKALLEGADIPGAQLDNGGTSVTVRMA